MPDSNLPAKTPLLGADVDVDHDLLGIYHPATGLNDSRGISVAQLAVAMGVTAQTAAQTITNNYLLAVAGTVHMAKHTDLAALIALAGGATQAEANARANALKASAVAHAASVGSSSVNGDHKAAEVTAIGVLAAVAAASTLGTCITLINALFVWHKAHAIEAGVHFHDDTAPASNTLTVDPPVTLANCITDLNDLLTMVKAHYARGVA